MLSIGSIFIGAIGLMAFYPILRELLRAPIEVPAIIVILVAYLFTVLAMFGILLWHGRRVSSDEPRKGNFPTDVVYAPPSFQGINTAQLAQPPASVTDHTTKTLDKLPLRTS